MIYVGINKMIIKELKEVLNKFLDNMKIYDMNLCKVEKVEQTTLVFTNYPYNKSDKEVVVII